MPEGDSLVRLAHRLSPVMHGQVFTRTDFRVPHLATLDLEGWTVSEVTSTGKYLSMVVETPNADAARPKLVVLSHLGMDGSWQLNARPSHRTRCIFSFGTDQVLGYSLARLDVLPPDTAREQLAFLGPDILDPGWRHSDTADSLRARIVANLQQAADQPIATALLDQRIVAGIGNIYRCEVLLLAGISPFRMLSELTEQQLSGLITLSHDLMALNIPPATEAHARRSTVDVRPDTHAIFGVRVATATERARAQADRRQRGTTPNYWVYGRQRAGCLRCGNAVRADALGTNPAIERTVYWCPYCQRG